jgi:uncharacterized Zn-binding protein involved in type VI secretion
MPGIARATQDLAGGTITGVLAPTVFVNGKPIAVKGATVDPHGTGSHASSVLDGSSLVVFANGIPICRVGDLASCGHPISSGSFTVFSGTAPNYNSNLLGVSSLGNNSLG